MELANQGALQAYAAMQSVATRLATPAVNAQTALSFRAPKAKTTLVAKAA